MANKFYTFTLVNPQEKETVLTTTQFIPKKVFIPSTYPHPDLSPMTDEDQAIIFATSNIYTPPRPQRTLRRKISAMF